jgi:RNA polymerase sigma-70 factor (ECF subfamily)
MTHAFFRRRIGSPELAAEQNQELYLSVVEHLGHFRGESSFRTWLFRLAHNRLSQLRRRLRVHVDERADELPEELWEQLQAVDEDADRRIDRAGVLHHLRRCLALLPDVERAVVFGQYYEQATLEELTRRLELTNRSGARASLIAAQRRLRRCLEQAGVEPSTGA